MEVILQKNYPSLGYVGDRVKVAAGFARNFLLPRGFALEASGRNERQIAHVLAGVNKHKEKMRAEASELSNRVTRATLEFTLKTGEGGKIFGAITTKDIEAAFKAQGFDIVRKQIRLNEAIKKPGEYSVSVKLHAEVSAELKAIVKSDAPAVKADAVSGNAAGEDAGKPRKGGRGRKNAKTAEGSEVAATEAQPVAPAAE
jgi:large subunit ribosomal protein L9